MNIPSYELNKKENKLLELGLNCAIKKKGNLINKQIEVEKLFINIKSLERKEELNKNNEDDFKTKLKTFGLHFPKEFFKDPLNNELKEAIKSLKHNNNVVIQRPDKGGGAVSSNE